jgi:hypothetical protein
MPLNPTEGFCMNLSRENRWFSASVKKLIFEIQPMAVLLNLISNTTGFPTAFCLF